MRRPLIITKPLLIVLLIGACTGSDPQGAASGNTPPEAGAPSPPAEVTAAIDDDLLAAGRQSWDRWCANCHGPEGRGDGKDAAFLDPKPRDQTDPEYMGRLTDAEIAETIMYGGGPRGYPNMPAVPSVFGDELVALVAFVRSLSQDERAR